MKKNNISAYSVFGLIGVHFFCCGLPLIAAIFGAATPFSGLISETLMTILFCISGVLLSFSWVQFFRGNRCNKTILFLSSALFVFMILLHIFEHGAH